MKKIVFKEDDNSTPFDQVDHYHPIFAKYKGKLHGMIVKESKGWILRTGGESGATGFHDTLRKCIESCISYGYTFYVE